ncbi:MAG: glycerophosphoryl diester phosphodiesterase membrane domain-containing protein [Sphingomonadales bacterium]|nr:glycerophosphoryl diester phosphodiesterase membrane domain-containing protein [Sphingomonadales bacterium]
MMQFDSSRAWRDGVAALSANRDVLLALAGVFFMLPWLAFMLLAPQPGMKPGMTAPQIVAAMQQFMGQVAPYLLGLMLIEACGMLAVLTLCTDRSRPTVGEAIRRGAIGALPYLGAMLLFVLGFMVVAAIGGALLTLTGGAGSALLMGMTLGIYVFGQVRMIMAAPVIAIEHRFQPWQVLKRSWQLTGGNVGRILMFLVLLVLGSQVLMGVIGMIVGSVAALVGGPETGRIAEAVVSAAMLGLFQLLLSSVMAAMHAQLAGPRADVFG